MRTTLLPGLIGTLQTNIKRKLQRVALFMIPVVIGYVAVGWSQKGGIFKPVQIIRSAVDSAIGWAAPCNGI